MPTTKLKPVASRNVQAFCHRPCTLPMLVFLISWALLSQAKSDSHAPPQVPVPSRNPASEICDDIHNCRTLFDIIWGCLATIFASTWVSMHANIPPPGLSSVALLRRKFGLMLLAILAPELVVNFALRQFMFARRVAKEFSISITHGFFISMGGFVTRSFYRSPNGFVEQMGRPIVTKAQLLQHVKTIRMIPVEVLNDKSKGDALSKGVALAQGLWFITQCVARSAQRLPLMEIEIVTLGFAFVNIFIWALFWQKPLDVQEPIPIGSVEPNLLRDALAPSIFRPMVRPMLRSWFEVWPTKGHYRYQPALSNSRTTCITDSTITTPALGAGLLAVMFGAIHCASWGSKFPTTDEQRLWRAAALIIICVPLYVVHGAAFPYIYALRMHVGPRALRILQIVRRLLMVLAVVLYIAARIILLVLAITTLRSLPANALVDVDWTVYIPHI
ncbi:hypothetical protein C8F01DRAFT_1149362 [Mycena amicta]|nr:hypothetical protein C8F01DRAFT_1149362 [Mycena amicta]